MSSQGSSRSQYVVTEFQQAVIKMSFEEFCAKTNILKVVEVGYKKSAIEKNQPSTELSAERREEYARHFYDRRHRVSKWQKCDLVYLKWKTLQNDMVAPRSQLAPLPRNTPRIITTNHQVNSAVCK